MESGRSSPRKVARRCAVDRRWVRKIITEMRRILYLASHIASRRLTKFPYRHSRSVSPTAILSGQVPDRSPELRRIADLPQYAQGAPSLPSTNGQARATGHHHLSAKCRATIYRTRVQAEFAPAPSECATRFDVPTH